MVMTVEPYFLIGLTRILDTNVILHDSGCIHQFKDNDIYIPITVIEELDKFKKGNNVINCNARDIGLKTENYNSQFVENISERYTGMKVVKNISSEVLGKLYQKPCETDTTSRGEDVVLFANENVILKNGSKIFMPTSILRRASYF